MTLSSKILCAAFLGSLLPLAHAATVQQNFGPGFYNLLATTPSSVSVPGFNPSLGTLTGIGFTYSASAVLLQGSSVSAHVQIEDPAGTLLATITYPSMGDRSQVLTSSSFTVPITDFGSFERLTPVTLSLNPFSACRGPATTPTGCVGYSGNILGQVTYTYTPSPVAQSTGVASAPEPTSLAGAGLGLMLFSVLCRRAAQRLA